MFELSLSSKSSIQTWLAKAFVILPYILFYLGMGLRFGSGDNDDIQTSARSISITLLDFQNFSYCRIILALDLEVWYLQSLKFVIALKFLGPKLFMLKNMVSSEPIQISELTIGVSSSFVICSPSFI